MNSWLDIGAIQPFRCILAKIKGCIDFRREYTSSISVLLFLRAVEFIFSGYKVQIIVIILYYSSNYENIEIMFHNFFPTAPRVHQLEGNTCEITWETIAPMRGDPVSYVLQVLVGRESEYKQVCLTHTHAHIRVSGG